MTGMFFRMMSKQKAKTHQVNERSQQRVSSKKTAIVGTKKAPAKEAKKEPAKTPEKSTNTTTTASTANSGKLPSMREIQEQKRKERQEKIEQARQKVLEQKRIKREHQKQHMEELRRKHKWTMATFTLGLFVMLTALICLFPTTPMIIFSTLLMFSFFFLGIAFQRMVMQLLVIAIATVFIVGAFYTIVNSI